jgi:hypothetical protein
MKRPIVRSLVPVLIFLGLASVGLLTLQWGCSTTVDEKQNISSTTASSGSITTVPHDSTTTSPQSSTTTESTAVVGPTETQPAEAPAAPGGQPAFAPAPSGNLPTQQAYLKASNTGGSDLFGSSVAISGDTMVVGAYKEASNATGVDGSQSDNSAAQSGAAYVFVRSGSTWTQQAYLKASNAGAGDQFGFSVAISGDTIVVGAWGQGGGILAFGAAYVFNRKTSAWRQEFCLKASDPGPSDKFGNSVAISGDTIVVGAPGEDRHDPQSTIIQVSESGAAYVFVRSGTTWSQKACLKTSDPRVRDNFGHSVAISGDTMVVSVNNAFQAGAAYVFVRTTPIISWSTWAQMAYLKASNAEAGDLFGSSVAISGDTMVVGAYREASDATGVNGSQSDNSAAQSGAAYVFVRSGTTWTQQAYLKASNTGAGDQFGYSVAISGSTVVVGAWGEFSAGVIGDQADNSAGNSGAGYVFCPAPQTSSLAYTGVGTVNVGNATTVLSATLSCPGNSVYAAGRTIDFSVDLNGDGDFEDGGEKLASGTSGVDGQASLAWTHAPLLSGRYAVKAVFAGSADCLPSSVTASISLVLAALSPAPIPAISGDPTVGSTLTAVPGTWGPTPVTLAYQWLQDGKPIASATASTYRVRATDRNYQISVAVTGSKPAYESTTKVSAAVRVGGYQ